MKRSLLLGLLLLSSAATPAAGSSAAGYEFKAAPGRHALGEPVAIRLVNQGSESITMGKTWNLSSVGDQGTAFYQWPDVELELAPGEERVWTWDQRVNACYGECQNVRAGDPAVAGAYEVTTSVDGEAVSLGFTLGRYFTLDFRGFRADEFVVYVASPNEVRQMREQTRKPVAKRKLIVSGVVAEERGYNRNWKFSMGPNSIVAGDFFIEVCDARPQYVQRHLGEWRGERWCPWGGYVKRVGR